MDPLTSFFGATTKIYSASALAQEISNIYRSLSTVYSDIAEAHFVSATQAFAAIDRSNSPEMEARGAINHLRDAYNIYSSLIGKTRKVRFLLFFSSEEPYIADEKHFYKEMTRIASFLCWSYRNLAEEENAIPWQKKAINNFDLFLKHYFPSAHELMSVNSDYVYESSEEMEVDRQYGGDGMPDYVETKTVTILNISSLGYEYINRRKIELKKELPMLLQSKKVNLGFQPGA
jgi:hypothetical protein